MSRLSQRIYSISIISSLYLINMCAEPLPTLSPDPSEHVTGKVKYTQEDNASPQLLPGSEELPAQVTPEVIQLIVKHNQRIATILKLINDPQAPPTAHSQALLLIGEPGVGKTTIAAALALASHRKMAFVSGAQLAGNQYQNSGIQAVDEKIGIIKKDMQTSTSNYIVVIDEITALTKSHKDNGQGHATTTHLWITLDHLLASNRVIVVATANTVDDIPEALKSRFGTNIITIESPNTAFRKDLTLHTLGTHHNLTNKEIHAVASATEGCTIRSLIYILKEAINSAYAERASNTVSYKDIEAAINTHIHKHNMVTQAAISTYQFFDKHKKAITPWLSLAFKTCVIVACIANLTSGSTHTKDSNNDNG